MDEKEIDLILDELNSANATILLSMVVTPDGLTLAYKGRADDFEQIGALFIELQLTCKKILCELKYGEIEEMFIRAKSGCVTLYPILDKGVLACLSTPDVNSMQLQMVTWRAVNRLSKVM